MAKIPTLFPDWRSSMIKKRNNSFTAQRNTQRNTQNAALKVDLFQNIFWMYKSLKNCRRHIKGNNALKIYYNKMMFGVRGAKLIFKVNLQSLS